uniref:POU domain protein n=1 Tax=Globodera rostochiensis TaxID=31243 RepID=A0A914IAT6_GLORO
MGVPYSLGWLRFHLGGCTQSMPKSVRADIPHIQPIDSIMDRFIYAANPVVQFGFGSSTGGPETISASRLYASGDQREENAGGNRGETGTDGGSETDVGGIMRIPTGTNSIFGCYGEDPFLHLQQARALAEMDVKGVTASMFHQYHPHGTVMDFDSSMGGILHASAESATGRTGVSTNSNNFQAEMAASLQQQMMQQMATMSMHQHAVHHYGVGQPSGASSTSAALYPSVMTPQGMALMGSGGLTNDAGGRTVGGSSFQMPFALQQQQQQHEAGTGASAAQQHHRQQHVQQQQQHPAQLRSQPSQNVNLSVPSLLPPSSGVPPSMAPSLSVLGGGAVKQSSQHNTHLQQQQQQHHHHQQQQQRYPVLHGAHLADLDTDPRELERFAEHFKQRRIKLGVTQADVGKALAYLKMPGVGSLSQSTICRFESLTLSHNNMVALKPILHSWLEKAEEATKNAVANDGAGEAAGVIHCAGGILPCVEKKRKRTSIAAPEKRMLEEFFRQQSRPTGDRISSIAEKLDLKKNVVRVWFCNQRQKQKRNQFRHCRNGVGSSASVAGGSNGGAIAGGAGGAHSQQQLPGGGNPQQLVVSSLSSSTAAATLAAAAMQAMQQQQRAQTNAGTMTTQFRSIKQFQQSDGIYGEAPIEGGGTMAQQLQSSASEEMSKRKVSMDVGGAERNDKSCGVIRHGFISKAMKMAPPEGPNGGTTHGDGMGTTTALFGAPPHSAAGAIFYLSRDRMTEN